MLNAPVPVVLQITFASFPFVVTPAMAYGALSQLSASVAKVTISGSCVTVISRSCDKEVVQGFKPVAVTLKRTNSLSAAGS